MANKQNQNEFLERFYAYIGDENGFVRVIDLTVPIENTDIKAVQSFESTFEKFFPFRKETIDVSPYADIVRTESQKRIQCQSIDTVVAGIHLREVLGHK